MSYVFSNDRFHVVREGKNITTEEHSLNDYDKYM